MLDLQSYGPGGRVSTGLLAWYQGRLVWALGHQKYWETRPEGTIIPVVGIGGWQEPGETLIGAVRRQALEETGARAIPVHAPWTLWCRGEDEASRVELDNEALDGEQAPLLVWQQQVTLRRDDSASYQRDYINAVYEAVLVDNPQASAEVPGLLFTEARVFQGLGVEPVPLEKLLADGVDYHGAALPPGVRLRLQGSARYLARFWGELPGWR
ncbi:MAG: hypothetical protein AB1331_03870 [Bacillota bacterium]